MLEINNENFLLAAGDIHNDEQALETLSETATEPNCLAFLYAGDLNAENCFILNILKYRNFVFLPVQGNCDSKWSFLDANLDLPLYRCCTYRGLRIFITHGHMYCGPSSAGLEDTDFDIVITGHSHKWSISSELISGKRVIYLNPGSPSRPRGGSEASYALIRFKEKSAVIEIRALNSNRLLSQETITVNKAPEGNN